MSALMGIVILSTIFLAIVVMSVQFMNKTHG